MADVKQILVVDDHFEMLELLRSMLRLAGHDYQVYAVPSAEEGMLELLRTRLDLLITDVRLPGMSGFDFVRRIRRRQPDLPVIMITAYSSAQGQKEAEELGIYRYFAKPLDTDAVLTAVHTALYGDPPPTPVEPDPPPPQVQIPDIVQRRLQTLQLDTGATGLVLSTTSGQILLELGDNSRLDLPRIVNKVAENVKNSLALADLLGEETPFTIQYHTGNATELYNANVGRDYFVTLIFGLESRRGRIGTIWVFAQRALRDLVALLPPQSGLKTAVVPPLVSLASPPPARPSHPATAVPTTLPPKPPILTPEPPAPVQQPPPAVLFPAAPEDAVPPAPMSPEPFLAPSVTPTEADVAELLSALNLDESAMRVDLDDFWAQAVTQPSNTPTSVAAPHGESTLSWQEAAALLNELPAALRETAVSPAQPTMDEAPVIAEAAPSGSVDDLLTVLNLSKTATAVDLDAFWEEAVKETETKNPGRSLSFEEARQRGLIHLDGEES